MIVTVIDRAEMNRTWGHGLGGVVLRTVEIADTCPVCNGPRGEPRDVPQCEDGEFFSSSCWANACGHVDSYAVVLREAEHHERN